MKKSKGIVDPVTLSLLFTLGIATMGVATHQKSVDQEQMAQEGQTKVELAEPIQEEPKT